MTQRGDSDGIVTIYRCQGCGKEHAVSGRHRLNAYGPYCSNHDPDGSGELYVSIRHEIAEMSDERSADGKQERHG